jgi:hypothetical protein
MEGAKQCSVCGVLKPLSSFHRCNKSRDGADCRCKQCKAEHDKRSRSENRLKYQFKDLLADSKRRAKKKNLPHDLDIKYLRSIATEYCPYQNVKLRWADDSIDENFGTCSANSPSIDRIDDKKGYVRGNVVIVSHRANAIKRDATEQELIELGLRIAQFKMQMAMPE